MSKFRIWWGRITGEWRREAEYWGRLAISCTKGCRACDECASPRWAGKYAMEAAHYAFLAKPGLRGEEPKR